jgi:uncharacterized phiE125 gp8 family phage protein
MPTIKVTDATEEPLTLAQVKAWTRVEVSDDDALFTAIILPAARQDAETRLQRTLITTTWKLVLDGFPPAGSLRLLYPIIQSVDHVKYIDTAGVQQTMDSSGYILDGVSEPGRLCLPVGASWPATAEQVNAVEVQYKAGWSSAAAVPAVIKQWIALRAAAANEFREQLVAGAQLAELPFADGLLDTHRVWSL